LARPRRRLDGVPRALDVQPPDCWKERPAQNRLRPQWRTQPSSRCVRRYRTEVRGFGLIICWSTAHRSGCQGGFVGGRLFRALESLIKADRSYTGWDCHSRRRARRSADTSLLPYRPHRSIFWVRPDRVEGRDGYGTRLRPATHVTVACQLFLYAYKVATTLKCFGSHRCKLPCAAQNFEQ
jgi:hypothetical protein